MQQHRAELTARPKWLQPREVESPDFVHDFARQVAGVEAGFGREIRGQCGAKLLRQPLDLRRLTGHQGVGLGIEHEVGRGPVDPGRGHSGRRYGVVGRVDLDDGELFRVEAQPVGGARYAGRIEAAGGDQRGIGPRAVPDEDASRRRVRHVTS